MKFGTRQLVTLAVFGALWGIVEISLGSLLHAARLPFDGVILASLGLAIALPGRMFVPKRGSVLFIGVIATLLKLFSIGSIVIGPMIGILFEALLAELVLMLFAKPSRLAFMLAGAVGVAWTLVQPFFTGWLIFGRDMFIVWLDLIDEGSRILGLDSNAALWIFGVLLVIRIVAGALAGWIGWNVGQRVQARLSGSLVLTSEAR